MAAHAQAPLLARIRTAAQHYRNGRRTEALLEYEEIAKKAAGDDAPVNRELGHLCIEFSRVDDAIDHYRAALDAEPDNAENLTNLAVAYRKDSDLGRALHYYRKAVDTDPEQWQARYGLGSSYRLRGNLLAAREHLEKAMALKPGNAAVRTDLALTLAGLNEHDDALLNAEKAIRLDNRNAYAHYTYATILTQQGRADEAVQYLEKIIRQHPDFGGAYFLLTQQKKFGPDDLAFISRTEKLLDKPMPALERYNFHFALGKMYDDCKLWDQAFEHFSKANLLRKKPYDVREQRKLRSQVCKTYTTATIRELQEYGNPSAEPVFIIGMPRSGTTLMERLIAAHPKGAGAGELPDIDRIFREVSPLDDFRRFRSASLENLTAENIERWSGEYLEALRRGNESAERIVDKMPGNYIHVGLISILFPNATIVHAIRHPLDSCLSCYFQNFTHARWSNDFSVIGEVYDIYRKYMQYWQKALPEGKIVNLHYEELIEDPETYGRRLVEGSGLSWDKSILDFYRQKGVVKSASLWQVRQPIYKTSRQRWMNYASHIGELANALAPYLEDERDVLAEHGIALKSGRGGLLRRMFG